MDVIPDPPPSVAVRAARLADLLVRGGPGLSDPSRGDLVFEPVLTLQTLARRPAPPDCWAVDGGQALVADARSIQLYVTRAARVRVRAGACDLEEEGELRAYLLGCGEERDALVASGAPVAPDTACDVNLLREWGEWEAVARAVNDADRGGLVLVDGDLQPDWRLPQPWLPELLERAEDRGVTVVGVTKHSSLARGGAPLVGQLEQEAEELFGSRSCWWVRVARAGGDIAPGVQVLVSRLDPDAPYAFRVDMPGDADAETVLGSLSGLCDDAAFPGYPYPLSSADRLAACPPWVRQDVWDQVSGVLDRAGVPLDVRDRAFSDRHRLMERS